MLLSASTAMLRCDANISTFHRFTIIFAFCLSVLERSVSAGDGASSVCARGNCTFRSSSVANGPAHALLDLQTRTAFAPLKCAGIFCFRLIIRALISVVCYADDASCVFSRPLACCLTGNRRSNFGRSTRQRLLVRAHRCAFMRVACCAFAEHCHTCK